MAWYTVDGVHDVEILKTTAHSRYNGLKAYFDVAIIEAKTNITFNNVVRPICLPRAASDDISQFQNYQVQLLGMCP